jgi:hypothetical protein
LQIRAVAIDLTDLSVFPRASETAVPVVRLPRVAALVLDPSLLESSEVEHGELPGLASGFEGILGPVGRKPCGNVDVEIVSCSPAANVPIGIVEHVFVIAEPRRECVASFSRADLAGLDL